MQNVSPRFDFLREKISTTALRRFFCGCGWWPMTDGVFGDGGRWRMATAEGRLWGWGMMGEATAEGRLDNCSPRLARLPGVGCRMRDLPPKSGCINYLQAGGWGFYNRSSAVVVNALMSRGRRANPVLTCETALRRFFAMAMRRAVGAIRWMVFFSMGMVIRWWRFFADVDGGR